MPYAAPTRTVGDVMQYVKRVFGDESGAQLEDGDLIMFINVAIDDINNRNRVLKDTAELPTTAGRDTYSFPSKRILQVEALSFNGQLVRNVSYAMALEQYIGQTPTGTDQPQFWWEYGGKFTFWPSPPDGTIRLDYTVQAQPVTNDPSRKLPLPDKFYSDLLARVLEQCYNLDEQTQLAQAQGEKFLAGLSAKSEEENSAQEMYYPIITLVD